MTILLYGTVAYSVILFIYSWNFICFKNQNCVSKTMENFHGMESKIFCNIKQYYVYIRSNIWVKNVLKSDYKWVKDEKIIVLIKCFL